MTAYRPLSTHQPGKHTLFPTFYDLGSLARHPHSPATYDDPAAFLPRCPVCNPNQYARYHSKHRKATP